MTTHKNIVVSWAQIVQKIVKIPELSKTEEGENERHIFVDHCWHTSSLYHT